MTRNSFIWVYDGKSCLWWFSLNRNVALTSLAWGLFFVLIGLSWIASEYYKISVVPYAALGAGIILIGLNLARTGLGMRLSKFSLFIGIVAFAFGGAALMGYELPLFETIIVLIGLFIIAEAARSLTKSQ
jgi:apolipoprotein N-acyltransferase